MNSLFEQFFYNFPTEGKPPISQFYKYDDRENVIGLYLQFALAGMSEKDIKVWFDGNKLYIDGDNMSSEKICDRFRNKFHRKLVVGDKLDLESADVVMENGLLTIYLPILLPEKNCKYLMGAPE